MLNIWVASSSMLWISDLFALLWSEMLALFACLLCVICLILLTPSATKDQIRLKVAGSFFYTVG